MTPLADLVRINIEEGSSVDDVLRRLKRGVNAAGVLQDLRHRDFWETTADKKKRKHDSSKFAKRYEKLSDKFEDRAVNGNEYNS